MFVPLGKRVLVERIPELSETKGGILIPNTFREKPMEGTIVSIGEDVKHVKPRDRILHAKYSGVDIKFRNVDYLILTEEDVLGIIKPETEK